MKVSDYHLDFELKVFWTNGLLFVAILDQYEAVTNLYIHEIALHNEHNVDDFRPLAHEHIYGQQQIPSIPKDFLTNAHLEALAACVDSMERAMVAFNKLDNNVVRGLPCLHMVWIAYVSVAMIRLYGILQAPDTKYGSIFLPHMNVEHHLDTTIQRLSEIAAGNSQSPAEQFLLAFRKLRAWQVIRSGDNAQIKQTADFQQNQQQRNKQDANVSSAASITNSRRSTESSLTVPQARSSISHDTRASAQPQTQHQQQSQLQQQQQQQLPQQQNYGMTNSGGGVQYMQQQYPQNSLLDPTTQIDASTFDIGNWDFNMNELNNFDTYMNEAGWMGYLL